MKMRTMRRLRSQAPRHVRRRGIEPTAAPAAIDDVTAPEAVFDRMTGPYGGRYSPFDEET